jgi:hypothetical protein
MPSKFKIYQHEQQSDSDDAPDEILLSSSRSVAVSQRENERKVVKTSHELRKSRRKEQLERSREEKTQRLLVGTSTSGQKSLEQTEEALLPDMLPEDILEALQGRKRPAETLAQRQANVVSRALQLQKPGVKKSKALTSLSKGPLTVTILSTAVRRANASRNNFKKDRLLGSTSKVKRSLDMLRPPTASQRRPASKFE